MPFVTQERRLALDLGGLKEAKEPGDLCYLAYKTMVKRWKLDPHWHTAHIIYRDLLDTIEIPDVPSEMLNGDRPEWYTEQDLQAAVELAWQVFFCKYVWPYELKKIRENGDIE